MKLKNTLLFCNLALLAACNNDDSQSPDNGLNLHKTVKFTPTEEAYNSQIEGSTKNVMYYQDNHVIADTTYKSGEVYSIVEHQYTANTHTATVYFDQSTVPFRSEETTYDNENRLIQKKTTLYSTGTPQNSVSIETFTYTDGSIIRSAVYPDTNLVMPQYTIEYFTNDNGLISSIPHLNNEIENLEFDLDKPLYYDAGEVNWTVTATYYDIPFPSNRTKTIAELNNVILDTRTEGIFLECNYYCKTLTLENQNILFERTFDDSGNILYSKQTESFVQDYLPNETFYYY